MSKAEEVGAGQMLATGAGTAGRPGSQIWVKICRGAFTSRHCAYTRITDSMRCDGMEKAGDIVTAQAQLYPLGLGSASSLGLSQMCAHQWSSEE